MSAGSVEVQPFQLSDAVSLAVPARADARAAILNAERDTEAGLIRKLAKALDTAGGIEAELLAHRARVADRLDGLAPPHHGFPVLAGVTDWRARRVAEGLL